MINIFYEDLGQPSITYAMATTTTKPAFICASCARSLRRSSQPPAATRALFSTTSRTADTGITAFEDRSQVPRWKQTPPAMKMAFRVRPIPNQPAWVVNEDQEVLDKVMDTFIGNAAGRGVRGRDVLPEEVKVCSLPANVAECSADIFRTVALCNA